MRLAILADPRAAALAGLDGSFPWGEAVTVSPLRGQAAGALPDCDVAVHVGDPSPEIQAHAGWVPGPVERAAGRTIATGGEGLWSRAPWPARDELFDLPPAAERRALVVGDAERRDAVVGKLQDRGLPVAGASLLGADDLAAASVVALLGNGDDALPAEAPAVLAARRLLIAPRAAVTFGLLAGTDHLAFETADDIVQYADAVMTFPDSFDVFGTLGAITAERHRASVVYGRLVADIAAEDAAGGR